MKKEEEFIGAKRHEVNFDFIGELAEEFDEDGETEEIWNKFNDGLNIPLKGDFIDFAPLLKYKLQEDMKKTFKTTRFEVVARLIVPNRTPVTEYWLQLNPLLD